MARRRRLAVPLLFTLLLALPHVRAHAAGTTTTMRTITLTVPAAAGGAGVQDSTISEITDGALGTDIFETKVTAPDGATRIQLLPGAGKTVTMALRTPLPDGGRHAMVNMFRVTLSRRPTIGPAVAAVTPEPISVEAVRQTVGQGGKQLVQILAGRVMPIVVHLAVSSDPAAAELLAWRAAMRGATADAVRADVEISIISADREIAGYAYGGCIPSSIGLPIGRPELTTPVDLQCESFTARRIRPWIQSWLVSTFTTHKPDRRTFTVTEISGRGVRRELTSDAILKAYEPPHLNAASAEAAFETVTLAFTGP